MEAGRDLDAMIAEKVMGWNKLADGWWDTDRFRCVGLTNDMHQRIGCRFSADIAAAMDVVKVITIHNCNEGTFGECEMLLSDDYWCVRFEGMEHFTGADTLPLAICLAALAKVGYKETTA